MSSTGSAQGAPLDFGVAPSGAAQLPTPAPTVDLNAAPNERAEAYNVGFAGGSFTIFGGVGMDDIASISGAIIGPETALGGMTLGAASATSLVINYAQQGGVDQVGVRLYLTTNGGVQVAVPSILYITENV